MGFYKRIGLSACIAFLAGEQIASVAAFQSASLPHPLLQQLRTSSPSRSSTELHAVLPPMIISGAIKKYRENQAQKRMPMATKDEAKLEAPGLRVGSSVWKWPPVWPYDREFFMPPEDIPQKKQPGMNEMASMLSGIQQMPGANGVHEDNDEANGESQKLNVVQFWNENKADVRTAMDVEAIQKLKEHFAFYLQDGMSILELGAGDDSYLPDGLTTSRHVGVGLQEGLMKKNSALSETLMVNLNQVKEDQGVDNEEFQKLGQETFDAIIMTNTVEYLTNPREVLRSAWYMLKPGGIMMVVFSGKDGPNTSKFQRAETKIWRDYNDDQHMWICGSFFEFSAGDGWDKLLGFDISPESAKEMSDDNPLDKLLNRGKSNNLYVVQAWKGIQDDSLNDENLEKSISSKMWMMPVVEPRDKTLVTPRLVRAIETSEGDTREKVKQAVEQNVALLPKVYEVLIKMDQFAFTFSMQAQLAADLITNPDFNGNEEQLIALKQGLGLRKPTKDFWEPIGQYTSQIKVEDKINLLGYIVPCFGSNDKAQEQCLQDFASGLKPTMAIVRSKCPDLAEPDVQLIATEFLAAEVLKPKSGTSREDFAKWLSAMTANEIKEPLQTRKSIRDKSKAELDAYNSEKKRAEEELEQQRKRYQEIVKQARENRSMVLNARTGKFEEYKP